MFILFDNYDFTFVYYVLRLCYQNKQDTLAGEYLPASNRTDTFDIVKLDTASSTCPSNEDSVGKSMPRGESRDLQFRYIIM